jgi:hypothetical protein
LGCKLISASQTLLDSADNSTCNILCFSGSNHVGGGGGGLDSAENITYNVLCFSGSNHVGGGGGGL